MKKYIEYLHEFTQQRRKYLKKIAEVKSMGRKVILTFENNEAKEIERALQKKYNCLSSLEALCVRAVHQEATAGVEMERRDKINVVRSLLPQPLDTGQEIRKLRRSIDSLSKIIEITFGGTTSINQRRKLFGIDPIEGPEDGQ